MLRTYALYMTRICLWGLGIACLVPTAFIAAVTVYLTVSYIFCKSLILFPGGRIQTFLLVIRSPFPDIVPGCSPMCTGKFCRVSLILFWGHFGFFDTSEFP
jgi:hypothetical protein